MECDYLREAEQTELFRSLLQTDERFTVPETIPELCTRQVIATTLLPGFHVDGVAELDQEVRDDVGRRLLSLTLRELFEFNVMQSDPNWGNYLYDVDTNKIGLIDFGASRECVAMG
jgi:aarF domain-containing kinase